MLKLLVKLFYIIPFFSLSQNLIITGVIDGPLASGTPKAVELYAINDINDLSQYGIGFANNGGGSDGQEFTLSGDLQKGNFIYISRETSNFEVFFGFAPTFTSGNANINGDDAIELFFNNSVIDVFGDINSDGTNQAWEYLDGWAYRKNFTLNDNSTFNINNWDFSGRNALDNENTNLLALNPFPLGTYNYENTQSNSTYLNIEATNSPQNEGNANSTVFNFTITRSGKIDLETSVNFTTNTISTNADDFEGNLPNGTYTFLNNETSKTIMVHVTGDLDFENDETFSVNISSANTNTQITNNAAIGLILNDDFTEITTINDIQGENEISPFENNIVTVEGIVIGDFQNNDSDVTRNLNGFYIQEIGEGVDNNPLTSEGIFISEINNHNLLNVNLGDVVRLTGIVSEYFEETQINTITDISILSSQNGLPNPIEIYLPNTSVTLNQNNEYQPNLEAYEGMLVSFSQDLYITEMRNLERFNEIKLAQNPNTTHFTQLHTPNITNYNLYEQTRGSKTIIYDDGSNYQNLPMDYLDGFPANFNTTSNIKIGDAISNLNGVLSYQWAGNSASGSTWRVRSVLEDSNEFKKTNPRQETPYITTNETLKIVSFNVQNYFKTLNTNSNKTAIGLNPRGANTDEEFNRQTQKLVTTLSMLDADIIGLIELENDFLANSEGNAIAFLTNALNSSIGSETYKWVNPNTTFIGSDAIANGAIYNSERIKIAENTSVKYLTDIDLPALGLEQLSPTFNSNRPPLAITFEETNHNNIFTVAITHLKSKSSIGSSNTGDENSNDGAGYANQTRLNGVTALKTWLDTKPTDTSSPNVIIIGDFNAYAEEAPIKYLENNNYTNVLSSLITNNLTTYRFNGTTGTLDYFFANTTIINNITNASIWHINADEPRVLDYNTDFNRDTTIFNGNLPYRSSDHNPILLELNFNTNTPIADVKISEFQPNPQGPDPNPTLFEFSGPAATTINAWLISIESDANSNIGVVKRLIEITGTFNADGLLTISAPDLENPSFTLALIAHKVDLNTDLDINNDGIIDTILSLGTIYDAIGVPDSITDESTLYAHQLGGENFKYTGDEPRLIFRNESKGQLYAINDPDNGEILDINGLQLLPNVFNINPLNNLDTFGQINPKLTTINPQLSVTGNAISISNESLSTSLENNTNFGNVEFGDIIEKQFLLTNNLNTPLIIDTIGFNSVIDFYTTANTPFTIVPNASQTITIYLSPNQLNEITTMVVIDSNDISNSRFTFKIKGTCIDTTKPQITTPNDITIDCSADLHNLNNTGGSATAIDNFDPNPIINYTDTYITDTYIQRMWHATDSNANTQTAVQNIYVIDTSPPTVFTQNITIYLNQNGVATLNPQDIITESYDNCSTSLTHLLSQSTFDCNNIGENTITITSTDESNNSINTNATITVADNTPPSIIPQNTTVYLDENGHAAITYQDIITDSSDNCSASLNYQLSQSTFNCSTIGENTITITATDINNNSINANAVVNVIDNIAPSTTSQAITLYLDENGNATITQLAINNITTDNCNSNLNFQLSKSDFDCADIGENNVTLNITDNNTNMTSVNLSITIIDDISPTVITKNSIVNLDTNGLGTITINDIDNNSFDNCSIESKTLNTTSFKCPNLNDIIEVTLNITDNQQNSETASALVSFKAVDLDKDFIPDACDTELKPNLNIKKGFSPNGDGINDLWTITGITNFPEATIQVFDKYGREVFNHKTYQNNWDGKSKINKKLLPVGSYYYIIDTYSDSKLVTHGWVYINY